MGATAAIAGSQAQSAPVSSAPPQAVQQNWFPMAIEGLGQNASSRTELTLDHNMVVLASKAARGDDRLRRVSAGVDGLSVRCFTLQGTGMYDAQGRNAVRDEYNEDGWQHIS